MKDKLQAAVKDAMRARDKVRLNTLRGILSAIQYEELQQKQDALSTPAIVSILQSEAKKRRESLEYAERDAREDMIASLREEAAIIEEFLPKQLSEAELEGIVRELSSQDPAANMGGIMKALRDRYSGQFDGRLASEVAKRVLQP